MRVALVALAALACVRPVEAPEKPQETGSCERPCYCLSDLQAAQRAREAPQRPGSRFPLVAFIPGLVSGLQLLYVLGSLRARYFPPRP